MVLVVVTISGVYIIQFFEQNSYQVVESRLDALSELLLPDLSDKTDLIANKEVVEQIIGSFGMLGFREQIYVIANNTILASSETISNQTALDFLNSNLLLDALSGERKMTIKQSKGELSPVKVMDKTYPIYHNSKLTGVLYIRYDLKDTEATLNKARVTILQSVGIALVITMLLSYIIAGTVTKPINEVTKKAFAMARGDFEQKVHVKSDDEIGKLGEMFNLLNQRLKLSINDLSREKSKLEAIINNSGDGLIALNRSQDILHINEKAKRILALGKIEEYSNYRELSKSLPDLLHFEQIITTYPDWRGSDILKLGRNTYQLRFEPFDNEGIKKGGLIIVLQDITERYALENMRRQFVADVSHELKTPITSIKSYAETLLEGALDDRTVALNFLDVINSETDRMTRLVTDLLQLSNFDAKMTNLDLEDNSYDALIKSVSEKLAIHINKGNHTLKLDLQTVSANFDYHRMEQVLINILSNAIKYTPNGGKIKIILRADKNYAYINVVDNGIGISKEDKKHLFERFYRVDKGRSRQLGGTGLGLSIVKEIVELHGGIIAVNSELGQGTEFVLRLPLEPKGVSDEG